MEHRSSVRYSINVPILFRWEGESGTCQNGGFTINVSTRGVFINSKDGLPLAGTDVLIELALPTLDRKGVGVKLTARGRVLRNENLQHEWRGFAVKTDSIIDGLEQ